MSKAQEMTLVACVPVYIVVGPNSVVSTVAVDDEALNLSGASLADECQAKSKSATTRRLRQAVRRAEACEDWPAWEFGW